ncbi:MAG: tetratricopeptide repeat protein [Gammaproteobacteria bacterium]
MDISSSKAVEALKRGDVAAAKEIFEAMAAARNAVGYTGLASIYERGEGGIAQDFEKARYWYERDFCETGSPVAACALARIYFFGRGVAVDYEKAFCYYSKIIRTDLWPSSLLRLGIMYEVGQGTAKNHQRARALYRRSARLGNIYARKHWAVMEIKHGNCICGTLLWAYAIIQDAPLAFINSNHKRFRVS